MCDHVRSRYSDYELASVLLLSLFCRMSIFRSGNIELSRFYPNKAYLTVYIIIFYLSFNKLTYLQTRCVFSFSCLLCYGMYFSSAKKLI